MHGEKFWVCDTLHMLHKCAIDWVLLRLNFIDSSYQQWAGATQTIGSINPSGIAWVPESVSKCAHCMDSSRFQFCVERGHQLAQVRKQFTTGHFQYMVFPVWWYPFGLHGGFRNSLYDCDARLPPWERAIHFFQRFKKKG